MHVEHFAAPDNGTVIVYDILDLVEVLRLVKESQQLLPTFGFHSIPKFAFYCICPIVGDFHRNNLETSGNVLRIGMSGHSN